MSTMTKKLLKKMKNTRMSTTSKVREQPLHPKLTTAAKKRLNWRYKKKLLKRLILRRLHPRLTSGHFSGKTALIRKYLPPRPIKKTFQAKTIIARKLYREY